MDLLAKILRPFRTNRYLEKQIALLKAEHARMDEKVKLANREVAHIQNQLEERRKDKEQLRAKNNELRKELDQINRNFEILSQKYSDLRQQLSEKSEG